MDSRHPLDQRFSSESSRGIYFDFVQRTVNPERVIGSSSSTQTRNPSFYCLRDILASYEIYTNPRHSESVMSRMYEFLEDGQLADVTLIADNESVHAHRLVLSAASNYFSAMFTSNLLESTSDTVHIKDVSGEALRDLVTYAYTGKITICPNNAEGILSAACLLGFMKVVELCSDFIKQQLDAANCIGILEFADARSLIDLRDHAWNYIQENFENVIACDEFLLLDYKDLIKILSSDELNIASESCVFNAVMKWINHDRQNRMQFMKKVLGCVKLPLLSPRYIAENVTPVVGDEGKDLVIEALEYHLLPQRRNKMDAYRIVPRMNTIDWVFAIAGISDSTDFFSGPSPTFQEPRLQPYGYFTSDIMNDRKQYLQSNFAYETFYVKKNNWVPSGAIPTKLKHLVQHAIATIGHKIYVVGGRDELKTLNNLKCMDVLYKEWSKHEGMGTPRHGLGLAVIEPNGLLYAIGGHDGWSYLSSVERWDVESGRWSFVQPLSTPRSTVGVGVINNKIYAVGGKDGISCLNLVEKYDPMTDKWKLCAPMIKNRGGVGVGVLHGLLYAFGGYDSNKAVNQKSMRHATVERYDPSKDKWSIVTKMDCGRDGIGVAILGNRFLTAGGFDGTTFTTIAELYDPITNRWTKLKDMNVGRAGPFLTAAKIGWNEYSETVEENNTVAEQAVSDSSEESEGEACGIDVYEFEEDI